MRKYLNVVLVLALFGITLFLVAPNRTQAVSAWAPNTWYNVGDLVTYGGSTYKCIQAHTSLVGWEPPVVPALWGLQSGSAPTNTPKPATTATKTNTPKPGTTPTKTPTFVPTSSGNGGGTKQSTYFTSYGYNDNDDGNGHYGTAVIAYPDSHHAIATEGQGTYADPVTFATDEREIPPHTMIYVPYLQKYFYMEDGCAECTTDWDNGMKWRTDLFMGPNNAMQPEPALNDCESYITRNAIMYIHAGPGYPVDTTPLFSGGRCTAHLH